VITVAVLGMGGNQDDALAGWIEERRPLMNRWQDSLAELNSGVTSDFAMYSVVLRELVNLARSETLPG
jgi:glutamate dehydrogenase